MEKGLITFILFTLATSILSPPLGYLSALGALILFIMSDKMSYLMASIARNKPLLLFIISILLSVLFSNVIISSLVFLVLVALQFAYYAMLMWYLENKGLKSLFHTLNLMAITVSVIGLFQFLTGRLEINKHWVGYSQSLLSLSRVYSTLYNPNALAAYLVINICFILSWIIYIGKEPLKQVSLIVCSICLLLTYSRGAFISLLFSLIIIYIMKREKRVLFYGAIMIIFFIILNNGTGYERVNIAKIYTDSSSMYRLEIWRTSFEIFLRNPFFGNGIGTLWYSLSDVSTKLWGVVYHAHNIFLHFAAEIGILGLLSFMYMVFWLLVNSRKIIKDNRYDSLKKFTALGAIGCSVAIIVHGLIDAAIVVPSLSLVLMNFYSLAYFAIDNR